MDINEYKDQYIAHELNHLYELNLLNADENNQANDNLNNVIKCNIVRINLLWAYIIVHSYAFFKFVVVLFSKIFDK